MRHKVAYLYRRSGNEVPHTGVYTADGYVVDARGHSSGVVRSLLHSYKWTDYKILRGQGSTSNKEVVAVDRTLQVIKGIPLMRGKDGWSWDRIAAEMHYDRRWVLRLHGEGLVEFSQVGYNWTTS